MGKRASSAGKGKKAKRKAKKAKPRGVNVNDKKAIERHMAKITAARMKEPPVPPLLPSQESPFTRCVRTPATSLAVEKIREEIHDDFLCETCRERMRILRSGKGHVDWYKLAVGEAGESPGVEALKRQLRRKGNRPRKGTE